MVSMGVFPHVPPAMIFFGQGRPKAAVIKAFRA
jgi:hypothetical protein